MVLLRTALLLVISNIFMTFAWYGHLRNLSDRKWYIAVVVSWGIALFEYMFMIPANRIGATELSLPQLKILQEAITFAVFAVFAYVWLGEALQARYLVSCGLIVAAVAVAFR